MVSCFYLRSVAVSLLNPLFIKYIVTLEYITSRIFIHAPTQLDLFSGRWPNHDDPEMSQLFEAPSRDLRFSLLIYKILALILTYTIQSITVVQKVYKKTK